ncbi:MAG: hypothetical protein DMD60_07785 [Gemmatimonadetes bacterium]|nr:MAG: hypothetical protein DMD60_07785 [Gemmatimonadota bacterium]
MAQIAASIGVAVLAGIAAVAPLAGQTSLSIYTDGRVVVRRSLPQSLDKGRNTVGLKLDGLDPATLFSPDTSVALVSAVLRPATDRAGALARAAGQSLAFVRMRPGGGVDTVHATVIRTEPPQYRLPDGRLLLSEPGEPLFPADLVRTAPEVSVALEAARARPRTDLAYVVDGAARWLAVYQAVLLGVKCQVSGTATISSQTLRADSADVQLVAGAINRGRPAPPAPQPFGSRTLQLQAVVVGGNEASEEAVGETHVYQLPGRQSLEPGVSLSVALFPEATTAYAQEFVVPGALPWRGFPGQAAGEPDRVPVQVWYTLKHAHGTAFGDRPLPGGTVQLYQADSAGRLQLLGEARTSHTAAGRDVRVQSGDAFDVTAERVQTDYNQEQLAPPKRGMAPRQRLTASYKVTISNAKATPVTVDVREARFGVWQVTESSVPVEKLSATEVRFRVPVPANGDATLTYTVQAES